MTRSCRAPEHIVRRMSDGYDLNLSIWAAAGSTPANWVMYLHGIQSHGAWFEWSSATLADSGLAVVLPDRRGSGRNAAARGDTPSADRWLVDLDEIAVWADQQLGVQRGTVGVSWGGKLAMAWALRRPERSPNVLLIAPGIFPAVGIGWLARLRVAASLLLAPGQPFPLPLSDPALFTDNPVRRRFIAADPRKLTHATARFLYHSARLDARLRRAAAGTCRAQLTLLLAKRDAIIRNGPTARWLQHICTRPPTIQTLDAAHTLEFEPDLTSFEAALRQWAANLAG